MRTNVLVSKYVDEASPRAEVVPPCRSRQPTALDGVPSWDAFSGDGPGCAPPPGPELAALLGEAVGALDELDERQLLGAGSAARRLLAHADYVEIMAVARFGRRRAEQLEASKARGRPGPVQGRGVRDRGARLRDDRQRLQRQGLLLDMAANIVNRLPSTLAGMAAGVIDRDRARVISNATLHLSDDLAAEADKILADAAPEIRLADLHREGRPAGGPPRPRGRPEAEGRGQARPAGRGAPRGTPARRACRAVRGWTRPRRWRGRRRSTPRRSGSATRAAGTLEPSSGRRSCWTGSRSGRAPGTASPRRRPNPTPTTPTAISMPTAIPATITASTTAASAAGGRPTATFAPL